ncbi:MarR family winged helix-turn-helix transcriptional regulator [Nonomuraea typhae]|uniref:MarR family winged helix-turn-helix transcriptional regulator n=1 Tax=Nonomuraea typhae TaxID=2603600 RepID=UPI0012F817CF|nr:MarR family transcriptional regulator [Nonomuraea typhae]
MSEADEAERRAVAERNLCGLVSGLARRIDDQLRERAATLGLTAPQATALRELTGPMTMRELAERMSCEPSNATFIADKLEKRGLVERRADARDRRVKRLVLTPQGLDLRGRLLALLTTGSPLSGLSTQEQDLLQGLLQRAIS